MLKKATQLKAAHLLLELFPGTFLQGKVLAAPAVQPEGYQR